MVMQGDQMSEVHRAIYKFRLSGVLDDCWSE